MLTILHMVLLQKKLQSMDELFQQLGLHITVTPRIKG